MGSVPGQGRLHAVEQLSPRATTVEAREPRAPALQHEKPQQWENPCTAVKSSRQLLQLESPPAARKTQRDHR